MGRVNYNVLNNTSFETDLWHVQLHNLVHVGRTRPSTKQYDFNNTDISGRSQ